MKIPDVPRDSVFAAFEARAARAALLAPGSQTAQAPLRFAAGLYRIQGRLADAIEQMHRQRPMTGRLAIDVERFIPNCRDLFRFAAKEGPPALAQTARTRAGEEPALIRQRLFVYWSGDPDTRDDYLSRAALRPYVEVLAKLRIAPDRLHRQGHCPFCGGAAWIAIRKGAAELEGAQRSLGCALCGGEWPVNRIRCTSCFEEDPHKLPTFQTEAYSQVRIEACETCHHYIKSIDLSTDARPIPEVDELLSLSMDVWAVEQGLTRVEPGLAGV